MIDLYTWGTTNGRRPIIFLEESGLPYKMHTINIREGQQKTDEYAKISPFRKIPSLIDNEGPGGAKISMFESVAMLLYLADKTGKFIGDTPAQKPDVLKWTMFGTATVLPTFSMMRTNKELEPAADNQLSVLDKQLAGQEYLAGPYSIADMTLITRLSQVVDEPMVASKANLKRWIAKVAERPAVKKALTMEIK